MLTSRIGAFSQDSSTKTPKRIWYLLKCNRLSKENAREIWKMRGKRCESPGCDQRATEIHYKRPKLNNSGSGYTVHCMKCHFEMHYPDEDFAEYEKEIK